MTDRELTAQEQAGLDRVAKMTDAQVLAKTGNASYGPALVGDTLVEGRALVARAQKVMRDTGGGVFGPAITDPDFAKKQAAKRAGTVPQGEGDAPVDTAPIAPPPAEGDPIDPTDLHDPRNPWMYVTLGGAKQLAMAHGVSYVPKVQRKVLIEQLQAAAVVPPAIPSDSDESDDA